MKTLSHSSLSVSSTVINCTLLIDLALKAEALLPYQVYVLFGFHKGVITCTEVVSWVFEFFSLTIIRGLKEPVESCITSAHQEAK